MTKKIELNEDLIKLISSFKFEAFDFNVNSKNSRFGWGIDQYSLFGGNFLYEDIAIILGYYDKVIPGTKESYDGPRFPEDLEKKMWDYYMYLCDNIEYILSLIMFYIGNGGLTPGVYECNSNEKDWKKIK